MWGKILYLALIVLATSFHSYWRGLCDQNPIHSLDARSPCSLAGCAALFKSRTATGKADRRQRRAAGSAGGQQSRQVFGPGKPCCPLSDPGTQVLYRKCFGKEMQFAYKMRGRQLYKVYKHCKKFVKNSFEKRVGVLLAGRTETLKNFSIFS